MCFSACQKDYENYPRLSEGPIDFTDYSQVALTIKVIDVDGNALSDVMIEVSGQQALTNQLGVVIFNRVNSSNRQLKVRATKNGFARGFYNVKVNNLSCFGQIALSPVSSHSFNANAQHTIFENGVEVQFNPGSFVDLNGQLYNGTVNVDFAYINPNQNNFGRSMPGGDFIGINNENEEQLLVSYGALSVELTGDNGQALQIANGYTSTLRMPVPNGYTNLPNQIPMWYFDEDEQVWIEEGKALLQGDKYIAEVSHFTWWNCDDPVDLKTFVRGTVLDCYNVPIIGIPVNVGPLVVYTDQNGFFETNAAPGLSFDVIIDPELYAPIYVESVLQGEVLNLGAIEPIEDCLPIFSAQIDIVNCHNQQLSANYYCADCIPMFGIISPSTEAIEVMGNRDVTLMLNNPSFSTLYHQFEVKLDDLDLGKVSLCNINEETNEEEQEEEEEINTECGFFSIDHFSDGTLTDRHFYENINVATVNDNNLVILAGDIFGNQRENFALIYLENLSIFENITYNLYGLDALNSQAAMVIVNKGHIFIPVNGQIHISKNSDAQLKLNFHSDNIAMNSISELETYLNELDETNLSVANQFLVNHLLEFDLNDLNFSGKSHGEFCK